MEVRINVLEESVELNRCGCWVMYSIKRVCMLLQERQKAETEFLQQPDQNDDIVTLISIHYN